MKEEKTIKPANGQLRKDEDICLILHGKVTETAPLDNGLTEIDIDVYTVNGTTPISSPVSYKAWFPLKVATPPNKGDEVTIRIAVVKPTSTADDFITTSIDYVGQIDGSQFDDFSFFTEVKSPTSRDGSFWILLPTNSVDNDGEEEVRLRFELIPPESDKTTTDEEGTASFDIQGEVILHTINTDANDEPRCFGRYDVPISTISIGDVNITGMDKDNSARLCYFPLLEFPEEGTKVTLRITIGDQKPNNGNQTFVSGTITDVENYLYKLGLQRVIVKVNTCNDEDVSKKDDYYPAILILPTSLDLKEGDEFWYSFELIEEIVPDKLPVPDNAPEQ